MNLITTPPQAKQFTATISQSVGAGTTANIAVTIDGFASSALAIVCGTSTLGGTTAGYPGLVCILKPESGVGRSASVMGTSYPASFESSLIAQISDPIFGGCRLNDCYIDNANSRLIFAVRNPSAGSLTFSARITGIIFP